jgi:hypothetical protein
MLKKIGLKTLFLEEKFRHRMDKSDSATIDS